MNSSKLLWTGLVALAALIAAATTSAGEPIRLTIDGENKRDPFFVDEGKAIIYGLDESAVLVRVMKLPLESKQTTPLFEDAGDKHHIEPAVSPDGRMITYTQCTGNLTARLVIRELDGKHAAYVTHAGRGGTRSPVFSPDGKRVVYAFAETGPQQLWSVNLEGQDKKQLTQTQGISNWPSFTPDGKTIVFANSRENNYEIYAMSSDGSEEKRLTNNNVMDIRPVVSPDGTQIAFTSTRDLNYEVYVMNTDGSNVRRITHSEERDDYPAWHPNGRQLVVVSERDGLTDLYLVDVPKSEVAANR